MRIVTSTLIGLFFLAGGQASAQQGPTRSEAIRTFSTALIDACLGSLETGISAASVPAAQALQLHPASANERKLSPAKDDNTPVWSTGLLGEHLTIAAMTADKCLVTADQLPIEDVVRATTARISESHPDFGDVPQSRGYWPVVRQWERIERGVRYTIHIDAAEPGAPGHAFRFSLIQATVARSATLAGSSPQQDMTRADRRAQILAALGRQSNRFLHVAPRIPPEILQNALKNAGNLAANQDVLAVVDQTAFHNGNVGVYFFLEGIVTMRPAGGPQFIPYDAIRGRSPSKGTFIVSYGNAQVPANLIGKDEMIAILSAILEATK